MKRYVKILIDGQQVDVDSESLSFALDLAVEGGDPGTIRGAHTKRSVSLPGTKRNRAIFEDIQEGTTVISQAHLARPCSIEVNGLPVLKGKMQLNEATIRGQNRQVRGYQIGVYGNNADWFQDIRNKRIRDLGYNDITLSRENIEAGTTNTWEDQVGFGLVKWRAWERVNSVHHLEFSICLFIKWILVDAFRVLGYRLIGDFIDTDLFKKLVLPIPIRPYQTDYSDENVNARAGNITSQTILGNGGLLIETIDLPDDSSSPNNDPGGNFDTGTYIYTAPVLGYYRFSAGITISGPGPGIGETQQLVVYKNLFEVVATVDVTGSGAWFVASDWMEYQAGDYFFISFVSSNSGVGSWTISDAFLEVEYEKRDVLEGETVELSYLIPPTWTVKDVVLDLQKVFGLVIDTDPAAGTIRIEPRDKYTLRQRYPTPSQTTLEGYYLSTGAEDVSQKVDAGQDSRFILINNLYRYYVQDYATDDETIQSIQQGDGFRLYASRYDFGLDRFPAGETVVNTDFFVKTYAEYDGTVASSASSATPWMPIIFDGNYRLDPSGTGDLPDEFGAHLLYFAGQRGGIDGSINLYNTATSGASPFDLPYLFMVNPHDVSGYDPSLAFSNEVTNSGAVVYGLAHRFHLQHLARIEGGRKFEHQIRWDELDISSLSFRTKRQIWGGNYLLEQVDGYNPLGNGSTKTLFFKDELPTASQAAKISQATLATPDSAGGGGSGGGGGSAGGSSTTTGGLRPYDQKFTTVSDTLTVTANAGQLPENLALIRITTDNGQELTRSWWTVSGSQIILSFTPDATLFPLWVSFWA